MEYAADESNALKFPENLSVSYCINPKCQQRRNAENANSCSTCGTDLLIQGQYRLLEPLRELHERDNTEVFATVDKAGKSKVLKILRNSHLAAMFEREAKTLQDLRDPSIPYVGENDYFTFTLDKNNGQELHCLVMEKIEGQNLEQWLEQNGPISQDVALKWLEELTKILEKLHGTKRFHRDIKLTNIMRRPDGTIVLIDFGSVRQTTTTYKHKYKTELGTTTIVSAGYSPQEQVNGKGAPISDFYSLGCCFVHLLTGIHPLDLHENPRTAKLEWHDHAPKVAPRLANLIDDLIEPIPGKRPRDTQEILNRLKNDNVVSQLKRTLGRIPSLHWFVGLNIVLLLANLVVGVLWFQARPQSSEGQSTSSGSITRGAGSYI